MRSQAVRRAEADLAAGALWKARDRLGSYLATHPSDLVAIELLGSVLFRMGDAPAAGRWWYFSAIDDEDHRAARAAFEHHRGGKPELVRSQLPRMPEGVDLPDAVRERLATLAWEPDTPRSSDALPEPEPGRLADALFVTVVFLLTFGLWLVGLMWVISAVVRAAF